VKSVFRSGKVATISGKVATRSVKHETGEELFVKDSGKVITSVF
jgi:hypothetical protein